MKRTRPREFMRQGRRGGHYLPFYSYLTLRIIICMILFLACCIASCDPVCKEFLLELFALFR